MKMIAESISICRQYIGQIAVKENIKHGYLLFFEGAIKLIDRHKDRYMQNSCFAL